jgi:hypothetical protein
MTTHAAPSVSTATVNTVPHLQPLTRQHPLLPMESTLLGTKDTRNVEKWANRLEQNVSTVQNYMILLERQQQLRTITNPSAISTNGSKDKAWEALADLEVLRKEMMELLLVTMSGSHQ